MAHMIKYIHYVDECGNNVHMSKRNIIDIFFVRRGNSLQSILDPDLIGNVTHYIAHCIRLHK